MHDAYTRTPQGEPLLAGRRGADGAIVIVRDPRDIAPSLANHNRTGIDSAITLMNDAKPSSAPRRGGSTNSFANRLPGWSGHIASWLDQTDIPVHLSAMRICRPIPRHVPPRTGFRRPRRQPTRISCGLSAFADFDRIAAAGRGKGIQRTAAAGLGRAFFRRGQAGGWRDELTAEQVARIEDAHAPMMRRLGYELAGTVPLARTA